MPNVIDGPRQASIAADAARGDTRQGVLDLIERDGWKRRQAQQEVCDATP